MRHTQACVGTEVHAGAVGRLVAPSVSIVVSGQNTNAPALTLLLNSLGGRGLSGTLALLLLSLLAGGLSSAGLLGSLTLLGTALSLSLCPVGSDSSNSTTCDWWVDW